jgi:hypothetical protein
MNDVRVLVNDLSPEGVRRVHVMGQEPELVMTEILVPSEALIRKYLDEIRLFHLEATWPPRGDLVEIRRDYRCEKECPLCHGAGCSWRRVVALFVLKKGERISQAIEQAAVLYAAATGRDPAFAWVRALPKGAEWGTVVPVGSQEIQLFSATWMPAAAVAVGRGN